MEREWRMPADAYFTTGINHTGLSNKDKQHCLINQRTQERVSLVSLMDIAKTTTLKNLHIPKRVAQQLLHQN